MNRPWLAAMVCATLLCGCATQHETYTLLPGADGSIGAITVQPREGAPLVLDKAYASARSENGAAAAVTMEENEVKARFAEALSVQPAPPAAFIVYFLEGRDELTVESRAAFARILVEMSARPAPDVMVVGHTDRVGKLEDNDHLALKRAHRIRSDLIREGIPADSIQVAGRGEREPTVPTADEVAEPRNRRVEILVR